MTKYGLQALQAPQSLILIKYANSGPDQSGIFKGTMQLVIHPLLPGTTPAVAAKAHNIIPDG